MERNREHDSSTVNRLLRGLIVVSFMAMVAGCAKDLVTGGNSYNLYNISDDVKMGEQVLKAQIDELKKAKKPVDDPKNKTDLALIQTITRRIAQVSHRPQFPFEAHLATVDVANAWCAPGGKVMVYTGLWDPKEGLVQHGNANELAAVLGHEIAHATARHVTESVSRSMSIMVAGQVAVSAIGAGGAVEGANLFGKVVEGGLSLYLPSYSRKNESEADRIGLIYMAKAGYDPRAAVALWERAAKKRGNQNSIFASHPASGQRAADLRKVLPEALAIYEKAKLAK